MTRPRAGAAEHAAGSFVSRSEQRQPFWLKAVRGSVLNCASPSRRLNQPAAIWAVLGMRFDPSGARFVEAVIDEGVDPRPHGAAGHAGVNRVEGMQNGRQASGEPPLRCQQPQCDERHGG